MMPHITQWLGREDAFSALDISIRHALRGPADPAIMKMYDEDEEDDYNPVKIQKVGNLAILNISGGMMDKTSWITRYLGIVTYEDIRNQMIKLASDDDTSALLLHINSPGGYAAGCFSLGRFVRAYNDNVKGVVGFTDGEACSAAYAMMAATSQMVMSEDALVGSIGVIAIHAEYTKMYEEIGIKHEVFRSTPGKAPGQSVEKMTAEARAAIQKEIMHMHGNFVRYLAGMMSMDEASVDTNLATGKTFNSKEATKNKLIHRVMTFEETVGKLATALEKPKPQGFIPQGN